MTWIFGSQHFVFCMDGIHNWYMSNFTSIFGFKQVLANIVNNFWLLRFVFCTVLYPIQCLSPQGRAVAADFWARDYKTKLD